MQLKYLRWLLPLIVALLNRLRGSDVPFTNKVIFACVLGLLGFFLSGSWYVGCIVMAGAYLGVVMGHGKYFSAFHGRATNEREVPPIDWLVDKVIGVPETPGDWRRWGTFAMCLSGLLWYPLFIGLAFYQGSTLPFAVGLLCATKGLIYASTRWAPEKYAVEVAESLHGLQIGVQLLICL